MEPVEIQLLETCERAARAGGQELVAWRGQFQSRAKGIADFVTDADLASQDAVRRVIAQQFPDHAFLGEEQAVLGPSSPLDRLTWVVDPLDGTTNYIHGYPHYAVSVAVVRGGHLLAGVVYDPVANHCFSAAAGHGAWRDGVAIKTSTTTSVGDALVAVSLPPRVGRDTRDLADFIEAVQVVRGVRRSGSAALNFAYLASGALDAFWASHIHPWDVAAGVLLVREAGGVVTGRNGEEFQLWNPHFLAAAGGKLHDELLHVLTPGMGR